MKTTLEGTFYINCALREDINLPCAWVYHHQFSELKTEKYNGLSVAKIEYDDHNCYVQIREADSVYLSHFTKHISYSGEQKIFEEAQKSSGKTPILFMSEYYRNRLHIGKIKTEVKNLDDIEFNKRDNIVIRFPQCLFSYIWYALMSCLQHPEMYARMMGITTIIAFFFALFQIFDLSKITSLIFIVCGLLLLSFSLWKYYKCACCYSKLIFLSLLLLITPKILSIICDIALLIRHYFLLKLP